MAVALLKQKLEPELKTYHATMLVTRAEEWCVEADSPEEARELLPRAAGIGVTLVSGCSSRLRASRGEVKPAWIEIAPKLAVAAAASIASPPRLGVLIPRGRPSLGRTYYTSAIGAALPARHRAHLARE
jgi:hypothetical protein